jgi:hypothetical protein
MQQTGAWSNTARVRKALSTACKNTPAQACHDLEGLLHRIKVPQLVVDEQFFQGIEIEIRFADEELVLASWQVLVKHAEALFQVGGCLGRRVSDAAEQGSCDTGLLACTIPCAGNKGAASQVRSRARSGHAAESRGGADKVDGLPACPSCGRRKSQRPPAAPPHPRTHRRTRSAAPSLRHWPASSPPSRWT